MADPANALSALASRIKFDKLETLLDLNAAAAKTAPTAGPQEPVNPLSGTESVKAHLAPPKEDAAAVTKAPAGTAPAPPPASATTRLSADAALISALLAETSGKPRPAMAGIDVSTAPPELAARALLRSLSSSGLFYEAHLEEWVNGERTLDSLRAEPQNRFIPVPARTGPLPQPLPLPAQEAADAPDAQSGTQPGATSHGAVPEPLLSIVREQLDALDLRRVHWQGEVWPRQQAELEIAEERASPERAAQEARAWITTLRIELPQLGAIEARIAFDAAGVRLSLRAAPATIETLRAHHDGFAAALAEAGIALRATEWHSDE